MHKSSMNVTTRAARIAAALALAWLAGAGNDGFAAVNTTCQQGDRGRLIGYERVGSYPTSQDARAHFEAWIDFYQDFFNFPENLPVTFEYGFDSYKVTYCTDDAVLPGQSFARTTPVTGMVSVPRKPGALPTVAYPHGTSISFYDVPRIFSLRTMTSTTFTAPRPTSSVGATLRSSRMASTCATSSTTWRPNCRRPPAIC